MMQPGQVVDVHTMGAGLETSQKIPLVKAPDVEIFQFIIPAGEGIPTYEAQGELVLYCLAGHVSIDVPGAQHELRAGQLIYVSTQEPFSIGAFENSSLLATIIAAKEGRTIELIGE